MSAAAVTLTWERSAPPAGDQTPAGVRRSRAAEEPLEWLQASGDGWTAAFSTRLGGVSPVPCNTLNLSLAVGDEDARVLENRRRLAAAAGFAGGRLIVPRQVHGTRVLIVDETDGGGGALSLATAPPETDALVTAAADLPLMITVADCVPVVLAARRPDGCAAIAVVHAGWRGLCAGIIHEAAHALADLGTLTAAAVGPSIGPCCFRVGAEVTRKFEGRFTGVCRDDRVDLWSAATQELQAAGVPAAGVAVAGLCTMCDARFFSHRGDDGHTGRQALVAWAGRSRRPGAGADT